MRPDAQRDPGGEQPAPLARAVAAVLGPLPVAAYVLDARGRIAWTSGALRELLGDVQGRGLAEVVPPDQLGQARRQLTRKLIGSSTATAFELDVLDRDGRRLAVDVRSAALVEAGRVVGAYGVIAARAGAVARAGAQVETGSATSPPVSPRQLEVLRLLGAGCGTAEIAERLGVSVPTVRNHVKGLLRAFGCRSRLQAVAAGRDAGLL